VLYPATRKDLADRTWGVFWFVSRCWSQFLENVTLAALRREHFCFLLMFLLQKFLEKELFKFKSATNDYSLEDFEAHAKNRQKD